MFYFSVLHSDDSPLMSAGSGMVDFVVSDRRVFLIFIFLSWVFYITYRGVVISSRETEKRKGLGHFSGFLATITHVYFSLHLASYPDL